MRRERGRVKRHACTHPLIINEAFFCLFVCLPPKQVGEEKGFFFPDFFLLFFLSSLRDVSESGSRKTASRAEKKKRKKNLCQDQGRGQEF